MSSHFFGESGAACAFTGSALCFLFLFLFLEPLLNLISTVSGGVMIDGAGCGGSSLPPVVLVEFSVRDLLRQGTITGVCTVVVIVEERFLKTGMVDGKVDAEAEPSHSDTTITPVPLSNSESHENCLDDNCDNNSSGSWKDGDGDDMNSLGSWKDEANGWSESVSEASTSGILGAAPLVEAPSHRMSWADMAQEDEFEEEQTDLNKRMVNTSALTGEMKISRDVEKPKLSRDQREYIRFMSVKRKKDFICLERVKGKIVNILEGLELHSLVFSAVEQTRIVNYVHELQELGSKGKLKGDCIPPHIDNHDFVRPFCTVSFVSECNIVFGTNLKVVRAGEFTGSIAIPLPVGSVLVLNGNAADVSKHCVPSVTSKRISITFRKMDDEKRPIGFVPEPDLQGIEPLAYDMDKTKRLKSPMSEPYGRRQTIGRMEKWMLEDLERMVPNQNLVTQLEVDEGLQISGGSGDG
ncbi:hypothetical protein GH714_015792 [Hevea brasiliensis]|uniref:Fe2OG dioxygenase domain-containing protein n=1 Tax=Hevea brasiliensis TaxID=3981 RepID=A0A6A6KRY6_HEVBR|nr:hypothetical protein GH714_015792 [Hevea brasiliensis]